MSTVVQTPLAPSISTTETFNANLLSGGSLDAWLASIMRRIIDAADRLIHSYAKLLDDNTQQVEYATDQAESWQGEAAKLEKGGDRMDRDITAEEARQIKADLEARGKTVPDWVNDWVDYHDNSGDKPKSPTKDEIMAVSKQYTNVATELQTEGNKIRELLQQARDARKEATEAMSQLQKGNSELAMSIIRNL